MNPRTVCFCQPIFSMISASVAPFFRCSMATTCAVFLPSRGPPSVFAVVVFGLAFGAFFARLAFLRESADAGATSGPSASNGWQCFGERCRFLLLGLRTGSADFCRQSGIVLRGCCGFGWFAVNFWCGRGSDGRFCLSGGGFAQSLDGFPNALSRDLSVDPKSTRL